MVWTIIYWIFMAVCGFFIGVGCVIVAESCAEVNDPHYSELLQSYAKDRIGKWLLGISVLILLASGSSDLNAGRELEKEIKSLQERVQTLEEQVQKENTNTYNI